MVSGGGGQEGGRGRDEKEIMEEEEAIRLSLTPHLHALMLASHQRNSCCPVLFERAAPTWWDPRFDSDILEGQYRQSSLSTLTLRFQYALIYIFVSTVTWAVYWSVLQTTHWTSCLAVAVTFAIASVSLYIYSRSQSYKSHQVVVSVVMTVLLMLVSLLPYSLYRSSPDDSPDLTPVAMFAMCIEVLLLVYTVIPMPLYLTLIITSVYSITFELLNGFIVDHDALHICVRVGLHICIHLIGAHIMIMTQVRMRGTFMSIGQSLLVRGQLEVEKALKEKMIHSVMPPKVADWLMRETLADDNDDATYYGEDGAILRKVSSPRASHTSDIQTLFRPFNMHGMDNVSILFADIVGFTRMSSNKTAEQLVGLLNDLFGRFDVLCKKNNCEKISTLGDCYYSVSGCPEPRPDHAQCCVNMGLDMIDAIQEFDTDTKEDVNMRVGIHTGKVLCGIVGTKRFKFDVWSNDVSLANEMESTGRPAQVHVSEVTIKFLPKDTYITEEGPQVKGLNTYFILGFVNKQVSVDTLGSCDDQYTTLNESKDSKKASSLPNILDCGTESDGNGNTKIKTMTGGGTKFRRSLAPAIDLPRLRLPRLYRNTDKAKAKTTSLPKIGSKNDNNLKAPVPPPPTPNAPSPPDTPITPQTPRDVLHNSWGSVSEKDPRKDSGIRSRRSSIQAQLFAINGMSPGDLLTHRVSGYYTSSQSSVVDHKFVDMGESGCGAEPCSIPLNESLTRFHQLRKQSDLQLIKCMQQAENHRQYIEAPPLSHTTLFFVDDELEKQYRQQAHKPRHDSPPTLVSTHFNTYFDILVSALVYIVVTISLFMLFQYTLGWLVLCLVSTCWHLLLLVLCSSQVMRRENTGTSSQIYAKLTRWHPWHICGASIICLPLAAVMSNFSCSLSDLDGTKTFFCYLTFVSSIHLCNFTQLNCWMKNILATIGIVILLVLVSPSLCLQASHMNDNRNNSTLYSAGEMSESLAHFSYQELVVASVLLVLLVWFLNREFEISYRLSFHGSVMAMKDKVQVQTMKNQADWLLNNIIPRHVADSIKTTAKYSENHKDVAVMFASIVNFNELYDEDYLGGKEYLRVLNELVADIDELLLRPEFKNIEKIKTIGSTYMAASGLDAKVRQSNTDAHQHIFELMEFALAMQKVIEDFNQDLIEFNLIIRIGLNFGDVTAGVIGTTKLYYDIWGDAVNIASRMDSTGVPGRIQVSNRCAVVLNRRYELERRGQVFVKGKDNMDVFLLKGRREDT
ncbi:adenylate cyclase type 9 isoform X2 [Cherax quadricarinatus]|uniref:adenylate cyclase type 9 isoform X2 n=1 Tax=Cherax quadricarinatus TaxID=27406 RepID=UPI0023781134|nr:adenylate cyclase type 9-like isoform X2 [Cherax quadricarinatus]